MQPSLSLSKMLNTRKCIRHILNLYDRETQKRK
ncbi:hypothetical protein Nmel_000327, partial [Mimus melanotis]